MKLIRYLPALLLIVCTSDAWQSLTVGRITVQFPTIPTRIDNRELAGLPATVRGWTARTPEGIFILLRTKLAYAVKQQDSAKRRAIYDSISTQALRLSKGRIVNRAYFATAAGIGQEVSYRYANRHYGGAPKPTTFFMRNVVVDSANYFLQFLPNDISDSLGLAGAEQRRRFFNSITVKS